MAILKDYFFDSFTRLPFFTPPSVFLPLKIIRGPGKTIKGVKTGIYPVLLVRWVSGQSVDRTDTIILTSILLLVGSYNRTSRYQFVDTFTRVRIQCDLRILTE